MFHVALCASRARELRAPDALDVCVVADGRWNLHSFTEWDVAHSKHAGFGSRQFLLLLQQRSGALSGQHACPSPKHGFDAKLENSLILYTNTRAMPFIGKKNRHSGGKADIPTGWCRKKPTLVQCQAGNHVRVNRTHVARRLREPLGLPHTPRRYFTASTAKNADQRHGMLDVGAIGMLCGAPALG